MDYFFYIFAFITLGSALAVVLNQNAVNACMFMIIAFFGIAALFLLQEAYFLVVTQVMVYAGAIMVLFLFVVMLLDIRGEHSLRPRMRSMVFCSFLLSLLMVGVVYLFVPQQADLPFQAFSDQTVSAMAPVDEPLAYAKSTKSFGLALFTKYMLPFQLVGFLLLSAMLGVIHLSRRNSNEDTEESLS